MDVRYGEAVYCNTYSRTYGSEDYIRTVVYTQVHVKYEDGREEAVTVRTKDVACRPGSRVGVVLGSAAFIPSRHRPVALVNLTNGEVGLMQRFRWTRALFILAAVFAFGIISKLTCPEPSPNLWAALPSLHPEGADIVFNTILWLILCLTIITFSKLMIWQRIHAFSKAVARSA